MNLLFFLDFWFLGRFWLFWNFFKLFDLQYLDFSLVWRFSLFFSSSLCNHENNHPYVPKMWVKGPKHSNVNYSFNGVGLR
jgi:hypothetical protein